MKKATVVLNKKTLIRLFSLFILGLLTLNTNSQTYFLRENFTTTNITTPPVDWVNLTVSGTSASVWRFDNSGNQNITFPISSPFAIFDATQTGTPSNTIQEAALETPAINASANIKLFLTFDHVYNQDAAAQGKIQALINSAWVDIKTYTASTASAKTEIIDLTPFLVNNAITKLRFLWQGQNAGFWAIDNVNIFVPLATDIGIAAIDNPISPFGEGNIDFKVSLANYGFNPTTSAILRWTVNGNQQNNVNWTGNIAGGTMQSQIPLGTIAMQAGANYLVQIWSEKPNNSTDLNITNDTITRAIIPSLCGTYTIGGANPQFQTFSQAVGFLHSAGVGCPVVFKVRDGVYNEQIEMNSIMGSSSINTVTFESESGDSSKVSLATNYDISSYPYTLFINGGKYIRFKQIGFNKLGTYWTYQALKIGGTSYDIKIENCHFTVKAADAIFVTDNADKILIKHSYLTGLGSGIGGGLINMSTTGSISIQDNIITNYQNSGIIGTAGRLFIERNKFSDIGDTWTKIVAIYTTVTDTCAIINNDLSRVYSGINSSGTAKYSIIGNTLNFNAGIGIDVKINNSTIANNSIHNITNPYPTTIAGIKLNNSTNLKLVFNTVNLIKSSKETKAVIFNGGTNLTVLNNAFSLREDGYPVEFNPIPTNLVMDKNNYFSPYRNVGMNAGVPFVDLAPWKSTFGIEAKGVFSNPFFVSDTVLTPNQILMNNVGTPTSNINYDIDSSLRNKTTPDLGIQEIASCINDAGIGFIYYPATPITPGTQPIKVILQNQGTDALTSATIGWTVNGGTTTNYTWNGNLPSRGFAVVTVGSYDFLPAVEYTFKSWTSMPNGKTDCNHYNDTTISAKQYTKLCGTYTIGGINPNFNTFKEAISFLNRAGITCPVVFKVRDGIYNEQIELDSIMGSSAINTVTFQSESGDSSKVSLATNYDISSYPYTLFINGAKYIRFKQIGFLKKGTYWDYYAIKIGGTSYDIKIENCFLSADQATGILIVDKADEILVHRSYLTGLSSGIAQGGINMNTSGSVKILENTITSFLQNGVMGSARKLIVENNLINDSMGRGIGNRSLGINITNVDTCKLIANRIKNLKDGISCLGKGNYLIIGNKIGFGSGTGIQATINNSVIANNWVYNEDSVSSNGIAINTSKNTKVLFNSIRIKGLNNNSSNLSISSGDSVTVLNNIFANISGGTCFKIANGATHVNTDYNTYYAPLNNIGSLNNVIYNYLDQWGAQLNGESNSLFCNPFFVNDSIFRPNQILIDNAGVTIDPITYDIDSTRRDLITPDMGVKEFDPCYNDAGINNITSLNRPVTVGKHDIKVTLQNQGISEMHKVVIKWKWNDIDQTPFVWTGILPSRKNIEVNIGSIVSVEGAEVRLKIWTEMPNDSADCNQYNDTTIFEVKGTSYSPIPTAPISSDTSICSGTSTLLSALGSGTIGWYSDSTGGNWLAGGPTFQTPVLITNTTYYAQDSTWTSSLQRTPVHVYINASPISSFDINNAEQTLATNQFIFSNTSTNAVSYIWNLSDGTIDSTLNLTHAFTQAGSYTIKLTSTSIGNCKDSIIKTVSVIDKSRLPSEICLSFTTCQSYNAGTAQKLAQIYYRVNNQKIYSVTPTKFKYFTSIIAPSSSFTVNINQTVNITGIKLFNPIVDYSNLFNDQCNSVSITISPSNGQITINVNNAMAGNVYTIAVTYDATSVLGYSLNSLLGFKGIAYPTALYTFETLIDQKQVSNSLATLALIPKNWDEDDENEDCEIKIHGYPNPSLDAFRVYIESDDINTPGTLKVMNVYGQVIEEFKNVKPGEVKVFGKNYMKGGYIITFKQGNKFGKTRLIRQ